ncbi:MAG TPA: cytochrome c [Gemmatimonadales bacterium]|nr:cytochrome c [Gemmatimonadales bacterium]
MRLGLRVVAALGMLGIPAAAAAQQADSVRPTRLGVYTAAQAARGRSIYLMSCASCHTQASHAGPVFAARWDGRLLWDLYRYVSELMPKSDPGSLAPAEYAGVVAYLLKMNGMPAGAEELSSDSTALKKVRIELTAKRDSTLER